jgi:tRNA-dihydrouridine synthase
MNADGFLINPASVAKHLQTTPDQKPVAQIYGGNPDTLIQAAIKIEQDYGHLFSGLELNTGCPSTTVMKCGGGSDMMRNREKTLHIIQQLSGSLTTLPFSIKTRTGLNDEDKSAQADFIISASRYCHKISIHGRTLKQLYGGEADRDFIQQVKQRLPNCQIIGNGSITSYPQAQHHQQHYQVDGIMIGQAAIGNPWIFTPHTPYHEEKLAVILRHMDLSVACDQIFSISPNKGICLSHDELEEQIQNNLKNADFASQSIVEFRKFLFQYVKGMPENREWKNTLLQVKNYQTLRQEIISYFEKHL